MEIIITSALVLSLLSNIYLLIKLSQKIHDIKYLKFSSKLASDSARSIYRLSRDMEKKLTAEIEEIRENRDRKYDNHYKQIAYYKKGYYALILLSNGKYKKDLAQMRKNSLSTIERLLEKVK